MRFAPFSRRAERGVALFEVLVSSTVLAVVASAVLVGSVTLQKSFRASQHYAQSQASQLRLIDYVALDLRRALSVSIPQPDRIELTIPDYYETVGSERSPRKPEIVRGSNGRLSIQYGAAPIRVSYYVERGSDGVSGALIREENGAKRTIATDVRDFAPNYERSSDLSDDSEQVFKVSVTFSPKFRWGSSASTSVRDGTRISSRVLLRNKRSR